MVKNLLYKWWTLQVTYMGIIKVISDNFKEKTEVVPLIPAVIMLYNIVYLVARSYQAALTDPNYE